ncbi:MAG: hypothetical protein ACLQNE_09395 [Thermoguttaceae bacterium]
MSRRIFNTLSLISAIFLACTVVSWVWSFWANPQKESLSFSRSFHVGVFGGRVEFFSDKDYGPYHGSIISLDGGPKFAERRGFGDTLGIYYRLFRWADSGAVLWTLSVSLAYPLILFAVLPAIWGWKWWRAKINVGSRTQGTNRA